MAEPRAIKILNPQGLHARPASLIVRIANDHASEVTLRIGQDQANCKSIMEVIMLASPQGAAGVIEADGPDAEEVLTALEDLFADGFGEAYE